MPESVLAPRLAWRVTLESGERIEERFNPATLAPLEDYEHEGLRARALALPLPVDLPEGYHRVTPYLILNKAADAIAFYKAALGAREVMRLDDPSGKIHHAEIQIGDSRIMLADEGSARPTPGVGAVGVARDPLGVLDHRLGCRCVLTHRQSSPMKAYPHARRGTLPRRSKRRRVGSPPTSATGTSALPTS